MTHDEAWIGPSGPMTTPPTKPGPDGQTLRRRWQLAGTRPQAWGHAEIISTYVPDTGQPDIEHHWETGVGPDCLVVVGWAFPACLAEYNRAWAAVTPEQ